MAANIGKLLKEEIARIAKREATRINASQKKELVAVRRKLAELRKQLATAVAMADAKGTGAVASRAGSGKLTRRGGAVKSGRRAQAPAGRGKDAESAGKNASAWFTAKGIKAMRKRLGLTQGEFSRLAGVSKRSVSAWELARSGKIDMRPATVEALLKLRSLGRTAAAKALAEMKK